MKKLFSTCIILMFALSRLGAVEPQGDICADYQRLEKADDKAKQVIAQLEGIQINDISFEKLSVADAMSYLANKVVGKNGGGVINSVIRGTDEAKDVRIESKRLTFAKAIDGICRQSGRVWMIDFNEGLPVLVLSISACKDSQDGKVSVRFTVDKATFGVDEAITLRCAIKNLSDQAITIIRPFGDSFYVKSSGLVIHGPDGAIPYEGAMKLYQLGTGAFVEFPAHAVVDETYVLPKEVFPGLGKPGLYSIDYQFLSAGHPNMPPPENYWKGEIWAGSVSFRIE